MAAAIAGGKFVAFSGKNCDCAADGRVGAEATGANACRTRSAADNGDSTLRLGVVRVGACAFCVPDARVASVDADVD